MIDLGYSNNLDYPTQGNKMNHPEGVMKSAVDQEKYNWSSKVPSTLTATLFSFDIDQTAVFYCSTSTILQCSTGRHWSMLVDAVNTVEVHFYSAFHNALI